MDRWLAGTVTWHVISDGEAKLEMRKTSAKYFTMKGYLTCVVVFLALCTAIFVTACAEDSAWGSSFGGIQQVGRQSAPSEPSPGSGSVPYVHEGEGPF